MTPTANIRQVALQLLLAQEQSGQPVEQLLEHQLREHPLADGRDRRLLEALVYGVLRWRGLLDQVVAGYARHPLAKMKPLTLAALRLGILQLLILERLPASAAINETIKALRAARQPRWLTGFVNAVLRKAAADIERLGRQQYLAGLVAEGTAPTGQYASPDPLPMAVAAWLSHPPWLRQRWEQRYGLELCRELCHINNCLPPLVLRVNLHRLTASELLAQLQKAGIAATAGDYAPAAVVLPPGSGRVEDLPGYALGWFAVQDEAAQLVTMLLAGAGPGHYLDACAGLGGKTAHLAELLPPEATITALEPQSRRALLLTANLHRLGVTARLIQGELAAHLPAAELEAAGASHDKKGDTIPSPFLGFYRGILVDAPCSGLGVIRRHPDIRWNRRAAELKNYQRRQLELLSTAAELLQPGGVLVYVVCSFEPEENEEVIQLLLKRRPELRLSAPAPYLPVAARQLVRGDFFRSLPSDGLDGFFAARLVSV